MFQGPATPARKVVDVTGDLVRHHQRQVGVGGLDLGSRLGFQARINRVVVNLVGLVDRCWLRLLLNRGRFGLESSELQVVHAFEHTIHLALKTLIGTDVGGATLEKVERPGKVLLGQIVVPVRVFLLASLILFLYFGNQVGNRIRGGLLELGGRRFGSGRLRLWLRLVLGCLCWTGGGLR